VTKRILGFDGIRGLSAIMVVFAHLSVWKFLADHGLLKPAIAPMLNGAAGVQAFFILSGFLITTLLITEIETTGTISLKHFFIRRSLRIFPLYILFLAIVTLIYCIDPKVTTKASLLYAYGYMYNFVPKSLYTSFLGHTWSLAVEEHFYLLWPFIFALFFKKHRTPLLIVITLYLLSTPVLHAYLMSIGLSKNYFIARWTFIASYNIAIGCLLAMLMLSGSAQATIQRYLSGRASLIVSGLLYVFPATVHSLSVSFDDIFSGYIRCIGITCAIGWLYNNQNSLAARCLEYPPLKYLGTVSYGIYMYQGLFLATGPGRHAGHLWPPTSQLTGLFLLIIVTPLSYHLFEKRFIRLKHTYNKHTNN
jgi:peptidoglycan/LPS O-acetylase OafA/YrhL